MDPMLDATPANALATLPTKELIRRRLPKILEAMPPFMRQRFQQAALSVAASPNIADCTPESVLTSIYACARLNLYPDPVLRQAYIIPFKRRATLILGYPGLIHLARLACPGLEINTGVVYDNDVYTLTGGTETHLTINVFHWQKAEAPGEVIFAYCAFKVPGADRYTTVLVPRYKLDEIASAKRAPGKQSPWDTNFPEMSEKTAIRRAARFWSLSADRRDDAQRFREALAVDEGEGELASVPEEENADLKDLAEGEYEMPPGLAAGRKAVKSTPV